MTPLGYYMDAIANLAVNRKDGKVAPHKAILLLAVIELIDKGSISSPFIPLSDELIQTFKCLWKKNVPQSSPFSCKISYPFFHMQSAGFWELVKTESYTGMTEYSSVKALKRDFTGAKIDSDLLMYLSNPRTREQLRQMIANQYLTPNQISLQKQIISSAIVALLAIIA